MAKYGMASCLVLLSPRSHWQTPIGVLQHMCDAACVCQAKINGAISHEVGGKSEGGADIVASDRFKEVAVSLPHGTSSQKQQDT